MGLRRALSTNLTLAASHSDLKTIISDLDISFGNRSTDFKEKDPSWFIADFLYRSHLNFLPTSENNM